CGEEYTRSGLQKAYSKNWEKKEGYNKLQCPKCEARGSFDITIYFSKKEREKMKGKRY
ncbi:hypothetical protein LCGC14_0755340, partial [marine sediment metagenome]